MKLLILCKRRPQGRDLLSRPYGRFYYLPYYLSSLGHNVSIILISYKNEEDLIKENGLTICSISIFPNPLKAIYKIYRHALNFSPDWIFGFSDTFYGILACFLSLKMKKKSLIDAYDNYEAYIPWFKPLHWLWRYSIRKCDVVTCAGPSLQKLFSSYRTKAAAHIIPMAVDPTGFKALNRELCRNKFNLPIKGKIIGYSGAINKNRGINDFFKIVTEFRKTNKDVLFVMSGRLQKGVKIPDGVLYVGYIPDQDLPELINCFDCMVVLNKDSKFGNYSYPIKLLESMQCEIPVAIARTKSTQWMMKDHKELLVTPGNIQEWLSVIKKTTEFGRIKYRQNNSWEENANKLSSIIFNYQK